MSKHNISSQIDSRISLFKDGVKIYEAPVSYDALSSFASNALDCESNEEFFAALSQHPSSSVREQVAYKDKLNEDTVMALAGDSSISVLRNLVRSSGFRRYATEDLVLELIDRDVEIACTIAQNFESFENVDRQKVIDQLISSNDPAVVAAVAGNYSSPKKTLKELLKHPDPYVAEEAKRVMDN